METNSLASLDRTLVDEVVIGAVSLLVEGEVCEVSAQASNRTDDLTVAVYCDKDQQSAVVLRCSYALAKNLTGKMLELEPSKVAAADMLDATGELVNVIAGNLRGLVSSPGAMTPPFALEERLYAGLGAAVVNTYHVTGESMQVLRM